MKQNGIFKSQALRLIIGGLTYGICSLAQAGGIYFIGVGFNNLNPSDMSMVKKADVGFDAWVRNARDKTDNFTINGVPANAVSDETNVIPFFSLAYRLNPKWVIGLDYTHPEWSERNYGLNNFMSTQGYVNILHEFDISPRVSYQLNSIIALGVGFDAKNISGRSVAIQTPLGGPIFNLMQDGEGWGCGWDAGITVKATKTTTASFAFFSKITNHLTGPSSYNNLNSISATDHIQPMAFVLRVTQFINKKWFMRFVGSWSEDSVTQDVVLTNTARGRITIPLNESDSYLFGLLTHYQFNSHWGFLLGGFYVTQVIKPVDLRPITTDGDQTVLVVGPSLKLSKTLSAQLLYGHVWYNSKYNYLSRIPGAAGRALGGTVSDRNSYEIRLSFKI